MIVQGGLAVIVNTGLDPAYGTHCNRTQASKSKNKSSKTYFMQYAHIHTYT